MRMDMEKVTILEDYAIAYDGVNVTYYTKGEEVEVNKEQLEKLVNCGVVELKVQKVIEPEIKKVVKPTSKRKRR